MVSSEQILGVMTVGRSVLCIPCLVPMCMIYSLMQSTSFSRFLFAKVKWSSVCSLFFSAMCVIDNEVHARTRWLRPRDDFRVDETGYAGERCKCLPPVLSSIHPQFAPSCSSIQTGAINGFLFLAKKFRARETEWSMRCSIVLLGQWWFSCALFWLDTRFTFSLLVYSGYRPRLQFRD